MKRTSSGTPPRSPSPTRPLNAQRLSDAPPARRARVRAEFNGMHHPGRPTVAVLVVGDADAHATHRHLVAWQRRAREVDYNYSVIEAGDAAEDVGACTALLTQHLPADARVLVLQADASVPPADVERAQDALGFAGLARQSRGPFVADHEGTCGLPLFPSEAQLRRSALQESVEPPTGEAIDMHLEAGIEARLRPPWQLQRQAMRAAEAAEQRVEGHARMVRSLASELARFWTAEEPAPMPPRALMQQLNNLQFAPHWQTTASTPQAAHLMGLLLRVGQAAASEPDSPAQLALEEIVRAMLCDARDVQAMLAAVDRWPPAGSDQACLGVLMRALKEHEVASGVCDGEPLHAPRWLARCVLLHDRLQTLAASVFNTLAQARVRDPAREARLRDHVEQAQLALLLGLEDALPDGAELSAPGFDPVAGVLFAAMLQVRRGDDNDLEAFMAQWAPWQTMVARLMSQGRWPPEVASTDSE